MCGNPARAGPRRASARVGGPATVLGRAGSGGRRLVLAGLLGRVGLLLGLVHGAVGVLRRAVDGVEDQRVGAGVDEVVLGARPARPPGRPGRPSASRPPTRASPAPLTKVRIWSMSSWTSSPISPPGGMVMIDELGVLAGPEHPAEVRALLGDGRDREMLHVPLIPRQRQRATPGCADGGIPHGREGLPVAESGIDNPDRRSDRTGRARSPLAYRRMAAVVGDGRSAATDGRGPYGAVRPYPPAELWKLPTPAVVRPAAGPAAGRG